MNNTNDYDAQYQSSASGGGLRWMSLLVIILIIFGFFSLVWYAYHTSMVQQEETIALIGAPREHFKHKPDEVGGLSVEHRDIESYELMRAEPPLEEEVASVERLLPAQEKPEIQEDTTLEKEVGAIEQAESVMAGAPEQLLVSEERKQQQDVSEVSAPPPAVQPEKTQPPKEEAGTIVFSAPPQKEMPKQEEPSAPPAPPPAPVNDKVYIQFAALRSQGEAERSWKKISARHADLLSGHYHYIEPVHINGKGTFYRLRAKGFASKRDALSLCRQLKARSQDCLVSQ